LLDAIHSARAQTYPNVEIVVVDNASAADIGQVVQGIGDPRIRFFRNDTNIGPSANFRRCVELARGEYMSWLQDDDAIFSGFCARAVRELTARHGDCYYETAIYSPSLSNQSWSLLYAPPMPLDWVGGSCRELSANLAIPMSLFVTLGMPPVAAYRRGSILPHAHLFPNDNFILFSERVFLAAMTTAGKTLLSPHVGGVFRNHAGQFHKQDLSKSEDAMRQLVVAARELDQLATRFGITLNEFSEVIAGNPPGFAREMRAMYPAGPEYPPLANAALRILDDRVNAEAAVADAPRQPPRRTTRQFARLVAHELLPPVVARMLRRLMRGVEMMAPTVLSA